jgi:acyl-CoA thioesterase-1
MMKLRINYVVFGIITCLLSLAQAKTVLVYGDSLSAGYGLKVEEGWVSLLTADLKSKHSVINASVSGETTSGGKQRLDKTLSQHKPDIVILELGGNDALRGLSTEQTQQNLALMIEKIQTTQAQVVLLSIDIPPNYGKSYRTSFKNIYPALAKKYKVVHVERWLDSLSRPIIGIQRKLFQADGIHPAAEAQPLLLKPVQEKLYPLLK